MNLEALVVMWIVGPVQIEAALLFDLVQIVNRRLARLVQISTLVHRCSCVCVLLRTTSLNL